MNLLKIFQFFFCANFSQNLKHIFYCPLFAPHDRKSGYGPVRIYNNISDKFWKIYKNSVKITGIFRKNNRKFAEITSKTNIFGENVRLF